MLNLPQVRWCAYLGRRIECGPMEVGKLAAALAFAHNDMHALNLDNFRFLANLINGDVRGWREIDIVLNGSPVGSDFSEIETHMTQLVESWATGRADPRHLYWEYEAIHPFGTNVNHAVGCMIYNWCNRTTGQPRFPPAYMMGDKSD